MNINLSETEQKLLVEMLTMAGFVISSPAEEHVKKAEAMHDIIQKIFNNLKDNGLADCFDKDEEANMLFPKQELINDNEDCIINLIREFNHDSAYEILAQQLAVRDLLIEKNTDKSTTDIAPEDVDEAFVESLYNKQEEYLAEFAEHGFENVQIKKLKLIV